LTLRKNERSLFDIRQQLGWGVIYALPSNMAIVAEVKDEARASVVCSAERRWRRSRCPSRRNRYEET
jgi:hypothetical protein